LVPVGKETLSGILDRKKIQPKPLLYMGRKKRIHQQTRARG
jgi:hypothetical protein